MKNLFLKLCLASLMVGTSLSAQDLEKTIIATKHNKRLTLGDIAEVQPGLGTIMVEFGHRFYITYYAVQAKNWGLAEYQLHELLEAQEVAEVTRPKYKKQLKEFEDSHIAQLQKAVKTKNVKLFNRYYKETTNACNECHKDNGHPYIQYKLPKNPPKYLRMEL